MNFRNLFCLPWYVLLLLFASKCCGIDAQAMGQSSTFTHQLGQRLTVTWEGQTLLGAVSKLSHHYQLDVWLDRRIDPSQTIKLSMQDATLQSVLEELASSCHLGVALLETMVYIGPRDAVEDVLALRENLHREIAAYSPLMRTYWSHRTTLNRSRLSEPRKLLRTVFAESPIELHHAEKVPHDLWSALQLPPMSRVDQAILILIGFNQAIQLDSDGKECYVVPIQHPILLTRNIALKKNTLFTWTELRDQFPDLQITTLPSQPQSQVRVTGSWSAQEKLRQALRKPMEENKKSTSKQLSRHAPSNRHAPLSRHAPLNRHATPSRHTLPNQQVYSLEIREQPLRNVLSQLSKQLPVKLKWDESKLLAAGYSLESRVSCKVQSVNLDQLLAALLTPVGLQASTENESIDHTANSQEVRTVLPLQK